LNVPEALLSGSGAKIEDWRRRQAVVRTLSRRADLLSRSGISGYTRGGVYLALAMRPSTDCVEEPVAGLLKKVSLLSECAGLCKSYGAARLFLIVEDPLYRDTLRQALGGVERAKLMPSLTRTLDWLAEKEGEALLVGISDEARDGARHWLDVKRLVLEKDKPVVFYISQEKDDSAFDRCDVSIIPLQGGTLSFYGKLAAVLDRFLGSK